MQELSELTKNDIISLIDETDVAIDAVKNFKPAEVVPEHDFYRSVLFGECRECDHRYVDLDLDCSVCRPVTNFLAKYKKDHPWKSEQKRG